MTFSSVWLAAWSPCGAEASNHTEDLVRDVTVGLQSTRGSTRGVPVSSGAGTPSFTGVVLSEEEELAFPEAGLWLLSCELAGSVKASWVELESESITTSLS